MSASGSQIHPALVHGLQSAQNELRSLEEDKIILLEALKTLTRWATGNNKQGNPYCHTEVEFALKAIARMRGWGEDKIGKDWYEANDE